MATKNLMDASADNKPPEIFDDKTGKYVPGPRVDMTEALLFIKDVYATIKSAENPAVDKYTLQFALQNICKHLGWLPYEIAVADQYASIFSSVDSGVTTG